MKLWNPFRRQDVGDAETMHVFQTALRTKVLPETHVRLQTGIGGVRRLREQIVQCSLEVLNGRAPAQGDSMLDGQEGVFGVLAEVESHVGRLASTVPAPADAADPGIAAQQMEYLVRELAGLEGDLRLVEGGVGRHRSELHRVLAQVEATRENLDRKRVDRAVIPKDEGAQKQVLRQREKKRTELDGQITNVAGRLGRQERHLDQLKTTALPDIPLPVHNGHAAPSTVGQLLGGIRERLTRLDPGLAPVEDPARRFGDVYAEAGNAVQQKRTAAERERAAEQDRVSAERLRKDVEKTGGALGEAVSRTVAVYREAVEEARRHVLEHAGEKGHVCSTEFVRAVKEAYDTLLRERGLSTFRAQVRAGNTFFSSLPDDFTQAMECLEELERITQSAQHCLHHEIEKQNERYSNGAAGRSQRIRSIPVQRTKPTKGKLQPDEHFVSPLLQRGYIDLLAEHQEACQKLQMISYGKRAERWSHPIQAWLRSRRKRAEAKAEPPGGRKR